ncbi:MAG: tetratricopeptide repeat protein, partial [Armatimonadetes bacterium]|nr:tetratricopeptide repeat protein [Armatimonadota bacterium]NIO98252.1 tetratricopeptide repeat protein [Armatimonadota bacterium]
FAQQAQDWPRVAQIAENLGLVVQEMGDHQEAAGYFAVSLKINRDLGNWANAAKAQRNIAYNLFQLSTTSEGGIDPDALSASLDHYFRSLEDVGKYRPP